MYIYELYFKSLVNKIKLPVPLSSIILWLPLWYNDKSLPPPKFILTLSGKFKLPVMFTEPVNWWVSSDGVSPNIVLHSENEVVICVVVDFTM